MLLRAIQRFAPRAEQCMQSNCKRYISQQHQFKDPDQRRRQYVTAACCVIGGAFITGVTFTTIPLGRLLCRVSETWKFLIHLHSNTAHLFSRFI